MTTFGRDSSHYTPTITDSNLQLLGYHTCKLTDGLNYYEDPTYKSQTDHAHSVGVPVLGSYHVLWGNRDLAGQADWWIARATALTPYWKDMPYIWQPDCESFGYNGVPSVAQINTFGDMVCTRAGVPAERFLPYAPNWVYGSQLTGLRYKNYWGSNYGSNPSGHFVDVYPGDNSSRWTSTTIPMCILQYGSNTDIGDANAFRGTLQQFLDTIKASGAVPTMGVDMPAFVHCNENGGYYAYGLGEPKWYLSISAFNNAKAAFGNPATVECNKLDDVRASFGYIPGNADAVNVGAADVITDSHGNILTGQQGPKGDKGDPGEPGPPGTGLEPGTVIQLGTTGTVLG